ncbi:MAG: sigma-E processing peptidase SpoIIGA [Clostridia bacterium]
MVDSTEVTTVYIDIIFLENLFMNFIILFATQTILKSNIKIIRTFIASILGGIYAILMYMSEIRIYSNICLKIILSLAMVEIAFNPKSIKSFFKYLVIFYLTSFTFGGVAFALIYFVSPENVVFNNGRLVGTYPIKMILLGGILGFIIIVSSFKNIKKKISKTDMLCNIKITIENKSKSLISIVDTGNFLKDPISKAPVIVVNSQSLTGILPGEILDNIKDIINGANVNIGQYIKKIRIIPFSSLGKENGLLLGIKSDISVINYQDNVIIIKDAIIGIYPGILNKENKYQALVGIEALESKGEKENEYFEYIKK